MLMRDTGCGLDYSPLHRDFTAEANSLYPMDTGYDCHDTFCIIEGLEYPFWQAFIAFVAMQGVGHIRLIGVEWHISFSLLWWQACG
jgi:hypothetical protein